MLSINEILDLIAGTFFDGNSDMAGIVMYIAVLVLVITVSKGNAFYALLVGMAATLLFSTMGVLSTEMAILLSIVSVLGMAYTARNIWRD